MWRRAKQREWRRGSLALGDEGGNVASEGALIHLVGEDTQKNSGLVVRVRLELGIDLNETCRRDSRDKTSLASRLPRVRTRPHDDSGRVQIFVAFLEELIVVCVSHLAVVVIESGLVVLLSWWKFLLLSVTI